MEIDKKSPIPIYFQLKNLIKDDIECGVLKPGSPIPSEREYSESYGISRMTVRQALKELEDDGLIVRERGRGSFVARPKIEQKNIMSFTQMVKDMGMVPSTEVIDLKKTIAGKLHEKFMLDEQEGMFEITRLRCADNVPVAVESDYIPERYAPWIDGLDLTGSLYQLLKEEYGIEVTSSKASFEAVMSDHYLEKILSTDGCIPLLKVESINMSDRPVFYEISFYRSDVFKYVVNIYRDRG
ncbi:MAG: GntR family transcriptional regulator [Thermoanaerobacteraceae bacterium]|nr:GntR family transcriptional regulator [Thermoanaerobacteraceae bacterium]